MTILSDHVTHILRFILNWLTRNLLAGVVIYCVYIGIYGYHYWFSWHVILCTVGIFPLMNEGLMLFPKDELWTSQLNRKQKYFIHGILFLLGSILVIAGVIDYIYYTPSVPHFNTIHGITGLVASILYVVSIFIGVLANYSQRFGGLGIAIKTSHNILGLLGYIVGIVSLCYAYYTDWFIFYTSKESRLIALIATILGTVWTINGSLASCYNQFKNIIRLLRR